MKYLLNQKYGGGKHFVWCSPVFRASKVEPYSFGAGLAPSSDPYEIYRVLHQDCTRADQHSAKISAQRSSLAAVALLWHEQGKINTDERDDIVAMISLATFAEWQPVVYAISSDRVAGRLSKVPALKRASLADEFIIEDLSEGEFDLIELAL